MRQRSTRRPFTRKLWIPALATLAFVLAACSTESGPENGQNVLRPKGTYAEKIDNLFTPIFWVAVSVGVFVIVGTLVVAIRFRVRKGKEVRPKQIHGSTPFEISWTIVPAGMNFMCDISSNI
jgi:heme/copper-type cytochrome/quinol oxidase subunit 2